MSARLAQLLGLVGCLGALGCRPQAGTVESVKSAERAPGGPRTCSFDISFEPDGPKGTGLIHYGATGEPVEQRIELPGQRSRLSRKYDVGGRLIEENDNRPDAPITDTRVRWTRDAAGRWTHAERHERTTNGEDSSESYDVLARDGAGRPSHIRKTATGGDPDTTYVCLYDARGELTEVTTTTATQPAKTETRRYQYEAGRLVLLTTTNNGEVAEKRLFVRDGAGRLVRLVERNAFFEQTNDFIYDAQGRIAQMVGRKLGRSGDDDPPSSLGFHYGPECRAGDKRLQSAEVVEEWVSPLSD